MNTSQSNGQLGGDHVTTALPEYLNKTLEAGEWERVEGHLSICASCRAELHSWQAVADTARETFSVPVAAPSFAMLDGVWVCIDQAPLERLTKIIGSLRHRIAVAEQLGLAQTRLLPPGIWVVSAAALLLCFTSMFFWRIDTYPHSILGAFVPLTTAVSMAFIYGPEYDDSLEVTLSTPISPRLVLLSRVVLVFAFNFALGLILTLAMVLWHGDDFSLLIAYWAGPTLLLASLSLLLSLTISSLTGIASISALWLMRFVGAAFELPGTVLTSGANPLAEIWKTSPFTVIVACVLLAIAVLYVPYQRRIATRSSQ
ncbi:MAG TPA: zf-HC2 domain-containing protein [Ktedonobacterales bacterium]|nr:zf-HC2 domain-containing protein [Ktedonobacterales bacterium]